MDASVVEASETDDGDGLRDDFLFLRTLPYIISASLENRQLCIYFTATETR